MLTSQLLIKTPQAETSNTKTKSSTKKKYTRASQTLFTDAVNINVQLFMQLPHYRSNSRV